MSRIEGSKMKIA